MSVKIRRLFSDLKCKIKKISWIIFLVGCIGFLLTDYIRRNYYECLAYLHIYIPYEYYNIITVLMLVLFMALSITVFVFEMVE
jgi:hypothetical protein